MFYLMQWARAWSCGQLSRVRWSTKTPGHRIHMYCAQIGAILGQVNLVGSTRASLRRRLTPYMYNVPQTCAILEQAHFVGAARPSLHGRRQPEESTARHRRALLSYSYIPGELVPGMMLRMISRTVSMKRGPLEPSVDRSS